MASTTTIKSRVLQVLGRDIGDDYFDDINAPEELWSNAVWSMYQMLPHRLLLTNLGALPNPEDLAEGERAEGDGLNLENCKVLLIFRTYANHIMDGATISQERYVTKTVKEVSLEQSLKALDPESIYFATQTSPVYWADNSSGVPVLKTAPATNGHTYSVGNAAHAVMGYGDSGLRVYKINRIQYNPTGTTLADNSISPDNWDVATNFPLSEPVDATGIAAEILPVTCESLVIKRIAQAVLEEKFSKASVGDEDSEVAELLVTNIKMLAESITAELETLNLKWEPGA